MTRVLIVEDEANIARLVETHCRQAGWQTRIALDGREGLRQVEHWNPNLVVLDLMLPGMDGLELCRRIRSCGDALILMLTAMRSEEDRVIGLEMGADDYLTKPFGVRELMARLRALLRRRRMDQECQSQKVLRFGSLEIHPARREVRRQKDLIDLTAMEFGVLYFLASRAGAVFSRDQILEQVWGPDRHVYDRSIDSIIARLRRKLEPDPENPSYLQTVWGAGYRFNDRHS